MPPTEDYRAGNAVSSSDSYRVELHRVNDDHSWQKILSSVNDFTYN